MPKSGPKRATKFPPLLTTKLVAKDWLKRNPTNCPDNKGLKLPLNDMAVAAQQAAGTVQLARQAPIPPFKNNQGIATSMNVPVFPDDYLKFNTMP